MKTIKDSQAPGANVQSLTATFDDNIASLKRALQRTKTRLSASGGEESKSKPSIVPAATSPQQPPPEAASAVPKKVQQKSQSTMRFEYLQQKVAAKQQQGTTATPPKEQPQPAPVTVASPASPPPQAAIAPALVTAKSSPIISRKPEVDVAPKAQDAPAGRVVMAQGPPPSTLVKSASTGPETTTRSSFVPKSPRIGREETSSKLVLGHKNTSALIKLGDMDTEKSGNLIRQLEAKCKWLEDELYRTSEVRVVLRLIQAQNLMPVDPNGKSDPYCVINSLKTAQGNRIQTKVVSANLDPVWDETFEFELPSSSWSFRIDLMDYDSETKSKPLGFVEMKASDWTISSKERTQWVTVQDGSGSLYVGLRAAVGLGLQRVDGDKYLCQCCKHSDIPDVFVCEKCQGQTCALCIGIFLCDTCREDICKRKKTLMIAEERVEAQSPQLSEYANAQRSASMLDPADWKSEHFKWPAWTAAVGDKAPDNLITVPKNYVVEHGVAKNPTLEAAAPDLTMLDPFETYPHYTSHLIKADHAIFVGSVKESSTPVFAIVEKLSYNSTGDSSTLLALVYSPDGTLRQKLVIDTDDLSAAKKNAAKKAHGADLRTFLMETYPGLTLQRIPAASHVDIASKMLEYERNHTDIRRRIGVLFLPKGVREENAVFKSTGSPDLYEFMDMLAERVRLQGWAKYAGGLNVKNNSTGLESYYTEFLGFNIMFHVNSLLEDDGSEQQLSRKRFIGNDLVVFIFVEGDEPFDPSMITSQMCHTFIVVKKVGSRPTRYRVSVVAKGGVPTFSPYLTYPSEYVRSERLRQFLLAKALNANRATFQAKTFVQKTKRTRKDLLARILKDLTDEGVLAHSPPITFSAETEPSPLMLCADNVQLRAVQDFIAEDATFLSFRAGDTITAVTANRSDVYWTGILNGRVGRFPSDKVELATKEKKNLFSHLKGKETSSRTLHDASIAPAGNQLFHIRIIQGKDMSVCDPWGTSDPYCTISSLNDTSGRPIRTKVINRNLSPVWDQKFEFANSSTFTVRVEIWDKDMVGSDDSMGYVDILSKEWKLDKKGEEDVKWLDVVDGDGQIQIGLTYVGSV